MVPNRFATAGALFAVAAAWPWIVGAAANLLLSPYERALQFSICGFAPHESAALLGHCAACWIGAAALAVAGLIVLGPIHGRASIGAARTAQPHPPVAARRPT